MRNDFLRRNELVIIVSFPTHVSTIPCTIFDLFFLYDFESTSADYILEFLGRIRALKSIGHRCFECESTMYIQFYKLSYIQLANISGLSVDETYCTEFLSNLTTYRISCFIGDFVSVPITTVDSLSCYKDHITWRNIELIAYLIGDNERSELLISDNSIDIAFGNFDFR